MKTLLLYYVIFFISFLLFYLEFQATIRFNISHWNSRSRNIVKYTILIPIALVPVIYILVNRYMVGTDFYTYERMYNDYIKYDYINYEYGIAMLFKISNEINWGYKGFLFLSAVFGTFLSVVAIQRQCNRQFFPIAVLIYLFIYFGPSCNIMAQVIAVSFVILSYEQMLKRNWKSSIIFCLLGSFFHLATLIVIPVYWAYNLEGKTRTRFISIGIIVIVSIFALYPSILFVILNGINLARYSDYIQNKKINTFTYLLLYKSPLILLELLYHKSIVTKSKQNDFYYFLVVLEIASCILGIGVSWAGRLAYFFSVAHVFIITKILEVTKIGKERLIVGIIIVGYFVIAFYMMHFFSEFDGIMVYSLA